MSIRPPPPPPRVSLNPRASSFHQLAGDLPCNHETFTMVGKRNESSLSLSLLLFLCSAPVIDARQRHDNVQGERAARVAERRPVNIPWMYLICDRSGKPTRSLINHPEALMSLLELSRSARGNKLRPRRAAWRDTLDCNFGEISSRQKVRGKKGGGRTKGRFKVARSARAIREEHAELTAARSPTWRNFRIPLPLRTRNAHVRSRWKNLLGSNGAAGERLKE